jgi:HAE1 family hydrophobic/amphiphilic exporter-1
LGGVTSNQAEAFTSLLIAILSAIVLVYMIMVATFRSLVQPLA